MCSLFNITIRNIQYSYAYLLKSLSTNLFWWLKKDDDQYYWTEHGTGGPAHHTADLHSPGSFVSTLNIDW